MKKQRIHFIGIGGSGMSGLAGILLSHGKTVSGSDQQSSYNTAFLGHLGAQIFGGHNPKNLVRAQPDVIIHSLAIDEANPELMAARAGGGRVLSYPEAVGELTKKYSTIAICGTHGKSTMTALIAKTLLEHGYDPTVLVGANLKELGGRNFHHGKGSLFVLEACEYRRAFLNYSPRMIVLNAIEPDHLDYYRDAKDYMGAFQDFMKRLPRDGSMFANLDSDEVHTVLGGLQANHFPSYNTFTYSTRYPESNFFLDESRIFAKSREVGELHLKIPGRHNRSNALGASAVASTIGMKSRDIFSSLDSYAGASRRFEEKGLWQGIPVIDDYAHHPTEIRATLQAARERFPKEKICAVFQPHQYSRTKQLLPEFEQAFEQADMVVIPNIYEARDTEEDKAAISAEKLVAGIKKHHASAYFGNGLEKTVDLLKKHQKKIGVILTMGAGDVWKIAESLTKP